MEIKFQILILSIFFFLREREKLVTAPKSPLESKNWQFSTTKVEYIASIDKANPSISERQLLKRLFVTKITDVSLILIRKF